MRSFKLGVLASGALTILITGGAISLAGGCGDESTLDPVPLDAGSDAMPPPEVTVLHPDAEPLPGQDECTVVITTNIPVTSRRHFPICTDLEYATNPPSGGDHWAQWAAFGKYTMPIPRPAYVHSEEHGAVVLLYRCPEGCPGVVTTLEAVFDEVPTDAICASQKPPPNARMLLAPDPEIPTPIAAAAWGATYTATCLDKPSLAAFVAKVYGHGPEATCIAGKALDPDAGGLSCGDGGGGNGGGGNGGGGGSGGAGSGAGGGGGS